jgi:hypothetical protein
LQKKNCWQKGVEEGTGETRVSKTDVEAQVMAWAHHTEPTWERRLPGTKTRAYANSCGTARVLHSEHLRFKAWQESRSRQKNRYGKRAVHKHSVAQSTQQREPGCFRTRPRRRGDIRPRRYGVRDFQPHDLYDQLRARDPSRRSSSSHRLALLGKAARADSPSASPQLPPFCGDTHAGPRRP